MTQFYEGQRVRVIAKDGRLGPHCYEIGEEIVLYSIHSHYTNEYGFNVWRTGAARGFVNEDEIEPIDSLIARRANGFCKFQSKLKEESHEE